MNADKLAKIQEEIKKIQNNKKNIVIAIDGRTNSGKTTIAQQLGEIYNARVIHADHFFLPFELRTKERLDAPGGNIHYERMKTEVIDKLQTDIEYRPYLCHKKEYGDLIQLKYTDITIIEGSYSLNSYFGKYYDLSVFLNVSDEEQKERIKKRCPERFNDFVEKWIPMENKYHKILDMGKIDLILM